MASLRCALAAVVLALLVPSAALAGGFTTARFGGENATPTADQPTAIYYNPAALALGHGTRIYAEGLFAWRTATYTRPTGAIDNPLADGDTGAGTPPDGVAANSGKSTLANFITSPFLGAASDLGVENLGVGLALFVPFGGQSSWDKNDDYADDARFPGAVDGPQRWSTIEGELRALYLSAGGAYRIPAAKLSVGASLSLVHQNINTIRARTAQGTDDLVAGDTQVEGRSIIDVKGNSVAAGLGVVWQPIETLWIGASYQSQPGFGESTQKGQITNKFGSGPVAVTDVEVLQSLPDVFRIGGRWMARPDVEVRLSADMQRWSAFDNQCLLNQAVDDATCDLMDDGSPGPDANGLVVALPRHWKDSYGVRGGGSYWVMPELELAAGLSFDSSAVPAHFIDPSLMDMNKLIAHGGVRYAMLDGQLLLDLTLNNVFYFSRDIEPRTSLDGYQAPSRLPDFAGKYELNVFFANLGAEYRF